MCISIRAIEKASHGVHIIGKVREDVTLPQPLNTCLLYVEGIKPCDNQEDADVVMWEVGGHGGRFSLCQHS